MRFILRVLRQQFIGVLAVAALLAAAASAATGGPVLLGKSNSATNPTVVQNTGPGAALDLKAKAGQPALKVNSNRLVPRLNADLLDGQSAGAFARTGSSYTKGQSDARFGRLLAAHEFTGSAGPFGDETTALQEDITIPGAGTVMVVVIVDPESDADADAVVHIDSAVAASVRDADNEGASRTGMVSFGAAATASLMIGVKDHFNNGSRDATGRVLVVFFPQG